MDIDPASIDVFSTWWGRLGLAGVLGVILFILVRWVGRRMTRSEDALQAQLGQKEKEDRAREDAMAKRLREVEDSRFQEMKAHVSLVVKAVDRCAASSDANERSRRKLDRTLHGLTLTLNNLPCNRAAGITAVPGATARTFTTPPPEDTPYGQEIQDEDDTPEHNPGLGNVPPDAGMRGR